jgi:hypothetical protein
MTHPPREQPAQPQVGHIRRADAAAPSRNGDTQTSYGPIASRCAHARDPNVSIGASMVAMRPEIGASRASIGSIRASITPTRHPNASV